MSATNAPTSPLTRNHSETQTQVEEDGDEKDDRLFEGANDPKERNRTSSAPTWHPPGLGQQQQAGAWEEHLDEEGRVFYHNSATGETTWDRPQEQRVEIDGVVHTWTEDEFDGI